MTSPCSCSVACGRGREKEASIALEIQDTFPGAETFSKAVVGCQNSAWQFRSYLALDSFLRCMHTSVVNASKSKVMIVHSCKQPHPDPVGLIWSVHVFVLCSNVLRLSALSKGRRQQSTLLDVYGNHKRCLVGRQPLTRPWPVRPKYLSSFGPSPYFLSV